MPAWFSWSAGIIIYAIPLVRVVRLKNSCDIYALFRNKIRQALHICESVFRKSFSEFNNIDGGIHRIMVTYKKDNSGDSGLDKGYILIPNNQ